MRTTALKTSHQPHWAAPRLIEPAEGAFFTRPTTPKPTWRAMPADHDRTIVRLLRIGFGLNILLWTGLAIEGARIF